MPQGKARTVVPGSQEEAKKAIRAAKLAPRPTPVEPLGTQKGKFAVQAAKKAAVELRRGGMARPDIEITLDVPERRFRTWMDRDPEFRKAWFAARGQGEVARKKKPLSDFESFRLKVLGRYTFKHQLDWVTWAEDVDSQHILIVTSPGSSKTTVFLDYLLYAICKNPQARLAYLTHSFDKARQRVGYLRRVIEENPAVQLAAGVDLIPAPSDNRPWSEDKFMVAARNFSGGEAQVNPTLQGYGWKTQIQGDRLDLIIIDDIDGKQLLSTEDRRKMWDKIRIECESRLSEGGRMIVICNRWDTQDVAGHIMTQADENPGIWKVYTSPAVLSWPENDTDIGEVVWPEKFGRDTTKYGAEDPVDPNGDWSKQRAWAFFKRKRVLLGDSLFALMYQCDVASEVDRSFAGEDVQAALDRGKSYTLANKQSVGIVIASQDPGGDKGCATLAAQVLGDDLLLLDGDYGDGYGTEGMLKVMEDMCRYRPRWFAIEGQGPWKHYVENPSVTTILGKHRVSLERMNTGINKRSDDIGITSMRSFVANNLIIPNATDKDRETFAPLVAQLLDYTPPEYVGVPGGSGRWISRCGPYDMVIALWLLVRLMRGKNLKPSIGKDSVAWGDKYAKTWSGGAFKVTQG